MLIKDTNYIHYNLFIFYFQQVLGNAILNIHQNWILPTYLSSSKFGDSEVLRISMRLYILMLSPSYLFSTFNMTIINVNQCLFDS